MTLTEAPAAVRELRTINQWVIWKWIEREGKRTKLLFDPKTGFAGSSTEPSTWGTYSQAVAAAESVGLDGKAGGIGFVVTRESGYTGIDLDHCIDEDGRIAEWAMAIVRQLDSYTERTPSGKGLRIWVRGLKRTDRCRTGNIEVYSHSRFFTVTGDHLPGTPETIEKRQVELEALCAELFPVRKQAPPMVDEVESDVTDAELWEKMFSSKHGREVAALFDGDTTPYGCDESRADAALISHLGWWTDWSRTRTDRMFRQSRLMREKWDQRRGSLTYGERTINTVFEGHAPGDGYGRKPLRRVGESGASSRWTSSPRGRLRRIDFRGEVELPEPPIIQSPPKATQSDSCAPATSERPIALPADDGAPPGHDPAPSSPVGNCAYCRDTAGPFITWQEQLWCEDATACGLRVRKQG